MRAEGLPLAPTFIPFTPWTTLAGYRDFLRAMVDLELVDQVAPVQLSHPPVAAGRLAAAGVRRKSAP